MQKNYSNDLYSEVFNKIYHQSTVYNSSFASVPYLLKAAKNHHGENGLNILFLISAIQENASVEERSKIDKSILAFYDKAITEANNLLDTYFVSLHDKENAVWILTAKFAFNYELQFSKILEGFLNEEFYCVCKNCSEEVFIWPKESILVAYQSDPVFNKNTKCCNVEPSLKLEGNFKKLYEWAGLLKQKFIQELTPYLAGEVVCPHCSYNFNLSEQLQEGID